MARIRISPTGKVSFRTRSFSASSRGVRVRIGGRNNVSVGKGGPRFSVGGGGVRVGNYSGVTLSSGRASRARTPAGIARAAARPGSVTDVRMSGQPDVVPSYVVPAWLAQEERERLATLESGRSAAASALADYRDAQPVQAPSAGTRLGRWLRGEAA